MRLEGNDEPRICNNFVFFVTVLLGIFVTITLWTVLMTKRRDT